MLTRALACLPPCLPPCLPSHVAVLLACCTGSVATEPQVKLHYTSLLTKRNTYYTIETRGISLGGISLAVQPVGVWM